MVRDIAPVPIGSCVANKINKAGFSMLAFSLKGLLFATIDIIQIEIPPIKLPAYFS